MIRGASDGADALVNMLLPSPRSMGLPAAASSAAFLAATMPDRLSFRSTRPLILSFSNFSCRLALSLSAMFWRSFCCKEQKARKRDK